MPNPQIARPLLDSEVLPAEGIVRVLEDAGIDAVFGMPGGNTGRIFDALYDHTSSIRTVLVREEARAGVMAEVYGRLTRKPGVAIGQAAFLVHASMGAIEARMSSTPMLLLTDLSDNSPHSHHGPYQSGTGEYGSWNAPDVFGGFTKATFVARTPAQAVQCTQLAIKHATAGEPGPVAVLFHSDALRGRVGPDTKPTLYRSAPYFSVPAPQAEASGIADAAARLAGAERPVIIAGNGVRMSGAYAELQKLSSTLAVPVATSAAGKGVFDETGDLALGCYGNFGTPLANAVIGRADVVLVVGSKLAPTDTAFENPELIDPQRQELIQVDIEPRNAAWTFPVSQSIVGDARGALAQLDLAIRAAGGIPDDVRAKRLAEVARARAKFGFFDAPEMQSDALPLLPQRVIRTLHEKLPHDAMVLCDAGENRLFMTHYFQTRTPGTFVQPAGVGGMGYAVPAALAAKLVHPERAAVAVCGDGGFAIGMNGLMTAVEESLPIVVVVFRNGALGSVKHGQGDRSIACEFHDFDHAAIARAMGCEGYRVDTPAALEAALEKALTCGRPALIDIHTSLSETFLKVTSKLAQ